MLAIYDITNIAMENTFCDYCRKSFSRKNSQIEKAKTHFCSNKCRYLSRKKGQTFDCFICNKKTYKSPKNIRISKSKNFFCSRQCSTQYLNLTQREAKNPNWKGGESSYRKILSRYITKFKCFLCGVRDPRILVVHHVDKNRKNNLPSNLIWLCRNCHFLVHHQKNVASFFEEKFKKYAKIKYKM
jgi:hypothetical protein